MDNGTSVRGADGHRRLRTMDRILLFLLVPMWLVGAGLHLREAVDNTLAWVGVVVAASDEARGYPIVDAFQPGWKAEVSGLSLGDRIVSMGGEDLAGAGPLRFAASARVLSGTALEVPVTFLRGGELGSTVLALRPVPSPYGYLLVSFSFALCGVFIVLRSPASRGARAVFLESMGFAFMMLFFHGTNLSVTYAWMMIASLSFLFGPPLVLRALLLVPEDAYPDPNRSYRWVWLFAAMAVTLPSWLFGFPFPHSTGSTAHFLLGGFWYLTALGVLVHSYRRSGPLGRRRVKWFFIGGYSCMVPFLIGASLTVVEPTFWGAVTEKSLVVLVAIPICILISVSRHQLFDIDRILSATASYNIVVILLAGAGVAVVPRLAEVASAALPITFSGAQILLSLGLAAIVIPAQRRVQPHVERLFFPERYAIDRGMDGLLHDLASCENPEGLTRLVGERLYSVFQPETCAVYAGEAAAFTPIFVAGQVAPPAFDANGGLLKALRERTTPIVAARFAERHEVPKLDPFDRAALETLAAAIVLPLRRGAAFWAFVCLGPKKSGDIYARTDLQLLAAVAEVASSELLRFEKEQLLNQARAMQESLRRYVPGVIADQLLSGAEVPSGEQEVSVLFVDIRGYTRLAERRRSEEIFATVNRYTNSVSRVARAHGGSVVEFNGDGMMVVFGAPEPLPDKERAAVAAGREIAKAVYAIPLEAGFADPEELAVGVGIATGKAFLGNILAVDRTIWSAIGNTTNLAARLQALTRELDAEIVIDERTWKRAGGSADDFVRQESVPIRGRTETEDVYLLPTPARD